MADFSDYSKNIKQDKERLRQYLASAQQGSTTKDSFASLAQKSIENSGTHLCIYAQPEEPERKYGLWFKTETPQDISHVETDVYFKNPTQWNMTGGVNLNTSMPSYNIIVDDYIYGFSTRSCVKASLDNPQTLIPLAMPATFIGGTITIVGGSSYNAYAITNYKNYIYIIAKSSTHDTTYTNAILKYDIVNDSWSYVNSVTSPNHKKNVASPSTMVAVNGKIYLFGSVTQNYGGYSVPDQSNYWILDPETEEIVGPFTGMQPRMGMGGVAVYQDRYIYMWSTGHQDGGNSSYHSRPDNIVHRFDTYDNTWDGLSSCPLAHCGIGMCPFVIGDKIFLFGMIEDGRYWGSMYSNTNVLCYEYDIMSDTYTKLPNLPVGIRYKITPHYDESSKIITLITNDNTSIRALYFDVDQTDDYEDNTVLLEVKPFTISAHEINLYEQPSLNTQKFSTHFTKARLWDKANSATKDVEVYLGNGAEWTKIGG